VYKLCISWNSKEVIESTCTVQEIHKFLYSNNKHLDLPVIIISADYCMFCRMQDRRKSMLKKPIADLPHQESQKRPSYLICFRSVKWHTRYTY